MGTNIYIIIAAVVLFVILVVASYVKTPPQVALIVSGLSKQPRVLIGKGGFRIPFFERLDRVFLGQTSVDIKTSVPVPTKDFINVRVDAVAKVRVMNTQEGIRLAAKNFLNMNERTIADQIQDSLEGNMREVIGSIGLRELNTDRDGFSDQIAKKAAPDMEKLGIEILSCNIQNITDEKGLISDLGADNTFAIKKTAAITKANAEKEIAIAQSKAKKEANDAEVENETIIAEKQTELAVKKADLKVKSDTQKAIADAAYEIQQQSQQKTVNEKTVEAQAIKEIRIQENQKIINEKEVEANIAKAKKEQELTAEQVKIKSNELDAQIRRQVEADKYQTETNAAADLELRKRNAEAEAYEAEQRAKAVKAKAEAEQFRMEQEAIGKKKLADAAAYEIQQKGVAEAKAIEMKGLAEAEAMEKKAIAFQKYGDAAKAQMVIEKLPEIAASVAQPISAIKDVRIYGGNGDGISELSGNVPAVIKQTMDTVSDATGVNMQEIMQASTLESAVKKTQKK